MTLETTLALAGALFVFSVAPGPCVMALTARSLSSTRIGASAAMAAGMVLGDLLYVSAALLGVAAVIQAFGEFFFVVRMAGAAYLIWLGVRTWRTHPEPLQADLPSSPLPGASRDFATGLMLCLGNPKVILFYVGFLPAFMDLTRMTLADGLCVVSIVAVVVGSVLLGNVFLAFRARQWFLNRSAMRFLHRGSGAVLVGAGLVVASET